MERQLEDQHPVSTLGFVLITVATLPSRPLFLPCFRTLSGDEVKIFRGHLIRLVLATDLAHSFEYITSFKNKLVDNPDSDPSTAEHKMLLMQVL